MAHCHIRTNSSRFFLIQLSSLFLSGVGIGEANGDQFKHILKYQIIINIYACLIDIRSSFVHIWIWWGSNCSLWIEGSIHHGDTENTEMELNRITEQIIGAAIEVHRALGPGLLESAYEECLCRELSLRSVPFQRQYPLPVEYKDIRLECGYRLDLLVADSVVVELKAVSSLEPIHDAQLLTYLKLGGWKLGLLINFNVPILKDGIRRKIL